MKLQPLTLAEHQQILYEILYCIDDFCKEHEINYFLVGGSLLGAIRHEGIIPWDDDIDIGMIRSDYERFKFLFSKIPPKGFDLLSIESTPGYYCPYIKVVKQGTLMKEYHKSLPKEGFGINIDIFPTDGLPGEERVAAETYHLSIHDKFLSIWWWRFCDFKQLNSSREIIRAIRYRFMYLFKSQFIHTYDISKKYDVRETLYCSCLLNGIYGRGEVRESKAVIDTYRVKFGDRMIPISSDWKEYLTGIYGDYMTPPPIEKRVRHSIDSTSFIIC